MPLQPRTRASSHAKSWHPASRLRACVKRSGDATRRHSFIRCAGSEIHRDATCPAYTTTPHRKPASRMGDWENGLIYARDFAVPHPRRRRMASPNVGDVPAATFAELLSGPVVDVHVGPSKRRWILHRNLLCHHSEYMQSELLPGHGSHKKDEGVNNVGSEKNDKNTDTQEQLKQLHELQQLELPDDDPAGFELLIKWLYQGQLDDVSDMAEEQKYEYAVRCQKLHLLCDRLGLPELKNRAMDQYRKALSEARLVPDPDEINDIYRKAPAGSPFRRLMTGIAARQIMDPDSDKDAESYRACFEDNADFAVDLVNAIKLGTGGMLFEDPTEGDECSYHDHDSGVNCHVKGKGRQAAARQPHERYSVSFPLPRTPSPRQTPLRQQLTPPYHSLPSPPLSPTSPSPTTAGKDAFTAWSRPKLISPEDYDDDDVFRSRASISDPGAKTSMDAKFATRSSSLGRDDSRSEGNRTDITNTNTNNNTNRTKSDKPAKPAKSDKPAPTAPPASTNGRAPSNGVATKQPKAVHFANGTVNGAKDKTASMKSNGAASEVAKAPSVVRSAPKASKPAAAPAKANSVTTAKPAAARMETDAASNSGKKQPPKLQRRKGSQSA